MRTLSETLTAAQKKGSARGLVRLVITDGETVYTFYNFLDRILKLVHTESANSYSTVAILDNKDNYFTSLDLKGYTATISWGMTTTAGDEYSACTSLEVVATQPMSYPGRLLYYVAMNSVLDQMAGEQSNANYNPGYIGLTENDLVWSVQGTAALGANAMTLEKASLTVSTAEVNRGTRFTVSGDDTVYTLSIASATVNSKNHWEAETDYTDVTPSYVIPVAGNEDGFIYKCTASGTSGETEPEWPGVLSETVTDGTVEWTCENPEVTIAFTPALAQVATGHTVTFYAPGSVDSPKDNINAICAKTLYGFTPYSAVTTSWDSEDDLIDVLVFQDSFRIYDQGCTRKERVDWLIRWTKEVYRLENDNELHFINPTVSGETYDYTYAISGDHPFLSKSYTDAIINPNLISVASTEDGIGEGGAYDESYNLRMHWRKYIFPTESMEQGNAIATAILQRATLDSQGGTITVPIMNVGQEVWDYVKITDAREGGVSRTGNIQKIVRTWDGLAKEHRFDMTITFGGSGNIPSGNALAHAKDATADAIQESAKRVSDASSTLVLETSNILLDLITQLTDSVIELAKRIDDIAGAYDSVSDTNLIVDKLTVSRECIVPGPVNGNHAASKAYVDGRVYESGVDTSKRTIEFCLNGSAALKAEDKVYARIPSHMEGYQLVEVAACCESPGSVSGQVTLTLSLNGASMLSSDINIDEGETDSSDSEDAPEIDSENDIVSEGEQICASVDSAGEDVYYCVVQATFEAVS